MKKLISIFILLFAASLLFADMESEKKQILSLFKSYEYVGTTAKNGGDYGDAWGLCNSSENRLPVKEFLQDLDDRIVIKK